MNQPMPPPGSVGASRFHAAPLVAALVVAGLAACLLRAGAVAPTAFGWSNSILLDGGWRMLGGQAPHVDFHSPIGYLYLSLVWWAMHLWGPTPHALAQAGALSLPFIAGAAWLLATRRLPPWLAAATVVFITVHAASIGFFGTSNGQGIGFGGQYSRIAWAVFFLIPLQSLIAPLRPTSRWREQGEHLVVGLALGVLFGIKITYFGAALGCIAIGRACAPSGERLRGLPALAGGLALAVTGGLLASGASLRGYLADLAMAQHSNATPPTTLLLEQLLRTDPLSISLLAAAAVVAWPGLRLAPRLGGRVPIPVLTGMALLGLGFAVSAYNGTEYVSPVYGLVLLVLVAGSGLGPALGPFAIAVLLGSAAVIGLPVVKAGLRGRPTLPPDDTIAAGPYHNVDFVAGSHAVTRSDQLVTYLTRTPHAVMANAYLLWLREGLAHLRAHAPSGAVIATMDVANPFPFALGLPSPRGDVLFWHLGRNVSAATAPPAAEVLGSVDVVMVPERPLMGGMADGKMAIYQAYLSAHFTRIPLTGDWWREVWIRNRVINP